MKSFIVFAITRVVTILIFLKLIQLNPKIAIIIILISLISTYFVVHNFYYRITGERGEEIVYLDGTSMTSNHYYAVMTGLVLIAFEVVVFMQMQFYYETQVFVYTEDFIVDLVLTIIAGLIVSTIYMSSLIFTIRNKQNI